MHVHGLMPVAPEMLTGWRKKAPVTFAVSEAPCDDDIVEKVI